MIVPTVTPFHGSFGPSNHGQRHVGRRKQGVGDVASLAALDGFCTVEYAPKANVMMAAELTSPISMFF